MCLAIVALSGRLISYSPAMRFCRGALPSRTRRCVSAAALCPRFTPAVCRMAPNRTACGSLRFYFAGSRSPFVRSRGVGAVVCLCGFTSGLDVPLWRSRRSAGDAGMGLAARRLRVFAQAHWHCNAFCGEYAGAKYGSRTAAAPDCAKESKVEAALQPLWTLFRG